MSKTALSIDTIVDRLIDRLSPLEFEAPVEFVYNPLLYAKKAHLAFWKRFGNGTKEIVLLGMNPGPWGMVQTGIPFGDVVMVQDWLNIRKGVDLPDRQHPKRPIKGFDCSRREVSGQRLWGWARDRFDTPRAFFRRFWVANYCPLAFMEASGRNRTPDKLPARERKPLLDACDQALVEMADLLRPRIVVGIGKFAAIQAERALGNMDISVGQIAHPSPANPKANAGWSRLIESQLHSMGIRL